jgi:hypothetical protein
LPKIGAFIVRFADDLARNVLGKAELKEQNEFAYLRPTS